MNVSKVAAANLQGVQPSLLGQDPTGQVYHHKETQGNNNSY